jgi:predicted nucleic acid-binding protein
MTGFKPAFWDSSAIVALCVHQDDSLRARSYLRQYTPQVVWWSSLVEVSSALCRLERSGELSPRDLQNAWRRLDLLRKSAYEVIPRTSLRDTAVSLLQRYTLRAADSLQLAAALCWCQGVPRGRPFVCFDKILAEAARREGFEVLS